MTQSATFLIATGCGLSAVALTITAAIHAGHQNRKERK